MTCWALMILGTTALAGGGPCVDFDSALGPVRPLHQAGQPPLPLSEIGWGEKMFHYLPEAGIRYSRLHDTGGAYGGGKFVDITNLFRDFNADENDPKSYDFTFTDLLLEKMATNGIAPFFRLGETIENHAHIRRYRTFVPADKQKWARVCEHVVRHYNEGWANGYRYNIEYWEIWNEPDFTAEAWNPMWSGTPEDLYDLYEVTATHLKKCFPHLKIGGPALTTCGSKYAEKFLKYCMENEAPLDFFSWHSYTTTEINSRWIKYVNENLVKAGYGEAEYVEKHFFSAYGYCYRTSDEAERLINAESNSALAMFKAWAQSK